MTSTGRLGVAYPLVVIQRPTADALRSDAAITGRPRAAAAMDEPFGDGSTSRGVNGAERSAAGDNDHGVSDEVRDRPTASLAPTDAANSAARSSRHGNG